MARRYQSQARRDELERVIGDRERIIRREAHERGDGFVDGPHDAENLVQDRGQLAQLNKNDRKRLDQMTPPSLDELEKRGVNKDAVVARVEQLAEVIKSGGGKFPGMRTRREMQDMPAGAVDMHMMHEQLLKHYNVTPNGEIVRVDKSKGQQSCLDEWKDLQRIVNKDAERWAPNITNLEILRPDTSSENDSLVNYTRRAYANPGKNLTAEQYEERIGIEGLGSTAKAVHEVEKAGQMQIPSVEEQFKKIYEREQAEEADEPAEEEWSLKMTPQTYLNLHPNGQHAALAKDMVAQQEN